MASPLIPDNAAGWVGYAVAAVVAIFAIFRDRRKADVDESAIILAAWKELMANHNADRAADKEEFTQYKQGAIAEIAGLRDRLTAVEKEFAEFRVEAAKNMAALTLRHAKDLSNRDDQIKGLKAAIAQNSSSSAIILGRSRDRLDALELSQTPPELKDRIESLDILGHNADDQDPPAG